MPLRRGFLFHSEFVSNHLCSGDGEFRIGENSSFDLSPVELFRTTAWRSPVPLFSLTYRPQFWQNEFRWRTVMAGHEFLMGADSACAGLPAHRGEFTDG